METTYKWCDGCYENQCNQQCHSCLENYIIVNNNNIEIKIDELYLTGNCYINSYIDAIHMNAMHMSIRLYHGIKFYGKINININNNNNNFKYNGDKVIMEKIIDYFLQRSKNVKDIFPV
jgi:hypothetical protein